MVEEAVEGVAGAWCAWRVGPVGWCEVAYAVLCEFVLIPLVPWVKKPPYGMAGAQCLLLWVVHHRRRLGPGLYSYLECYLLLRREEGRVLTYRERADHVSRQREGASCEGARASSLVYSS